MSFASSTRAADVASTVNLLFGGSGEFSGTSGLRGTLSDELQRQNVPPAGTAPNPHTGQAGNGGGASFGGAVTIVPDELTNSLLIRASDEDFQILTVAVDQLDIRPLQVLIEVLIVEARRDRSFSLNTSLFKPAQSGHNPTTTEGRLQQGSSGLSELIIRLMDLGKPDIDAALSVSESKGDVQIISRPVLLATNNSEARFLVGSQRPFVQVSRSLPTDVAQRDQVVQYRDVGTKLTVRPTINQDGYVSLFIQQEVNAATGEVAFEAPVISTREAVTQLLVRDSQTIVIGGLRDLQKDRNSSGIPVLSGLPLIGGLFGSSSRRTTATELYLFLTPRILRSDAEVDSATAARRSHVEFDR
jgi:general secretion pathway protein D